jgi:rhodanese-related sulfurtransferase
MLSRLARSMSSAASSRKPGVASPSQLSAFLSAAGPHICILDARAPEAAAEPSSSLGALAPSASRPRAISAPLDRATGELPLAAIPPAWIAAAGGKDKLCIITHCGGGGRGQKAKDFLLKSGFSQVLNGGGPEDAECWAVIGSR